MSNVHEVYWSIIIEGQEADMSVLHQVLVISHKRNIDTNMITEPSNESFDVFLRCNPDRILECTQTVMI